VKRQPALRYRRLLKSIRRLATDNIYAISNQSLQFRFRNGKLRKAAVQANQELRKDPDSAFRQTFVAREVNVNFGGKRPHFRELTPLTAHRAPPKKHSLSVMEKHIAA